MVMEKKKRRKIKKRWYFLTLILIASVVGYFSLFYDDGSVSSFIDTEGEQEFMEAYNEAMSYLPEPAEEVLLTTSFGQVKLYKFQASETEGTPLLLLPGKSASTPMWEANLQDLIQERPVYTIDLIGEPGLSVETTRIKTIQDQATWLKEVVSSLDEAEIHLLGLSFGGWSAVNLLVQEEVPQVKSLILVEPVYVFDTIPLKMVLASIPASVPFIPQSIRDRMLSYISGGADTEDEPISRLIETGMRTFKSKLPMPQKISKEELESLTVPTLAILGGKSTMHNPDKAFAAAEANLTHPQSEAVLFDQASHAINGEYPEELAARIQMFLTRLEP